MHHEAIPVFVVLSIIVLLQTRHIQHPAQF